VDGFMDLLSASLRPALERRDAITDAQGQISDVKTAFSSWDNCMNAVYCKYASPSCSPLGTPTPPMVSPCLTNPDGP
jgi:hypothetical protein